MFDDMSPTVRNLLMAILIVHIVVVMSLCAYGIYRNVSPMDEFIAKQKLNNKQKDE